jgi:hypothetical protein
VGLAVVCSLGGGPPRRSLGDAREAEEFEQELVDQFCWLGWALA